MVMPMARPMQDDAPRDVMKMAPMALETGRRIVQMARIVPAVGRAMMMAMAAASMTSVTAAAEAKAETAANNVDAESAAADHAVRFRAARRSFNRQITCLQA